MECKKGIQGRVYWKSYSESTVKRWIDAVNDSLKKIGLDVRQARRMVHDREHRVGV